MAWDVLKPVNLALNIEVLKPCAEISLEMANHVGI
jgi:hypothetical protein